MSIIQYEHVRGNYNRTVEKIRKQQEEINRLEEYKKASILVISEMVKMQDEHDTNKRNKNIQLQGYRDAINIGNIVHKAIVHKAFE